MGNQVTQDPGETSYRNETRVKVLGRKGQGQVVQKNSTNKDKGDCRVRIVGRHETIRTPKGRGTKEREDAEQKIDGKKKIIPGRLLREESQNVDREKLAKKKEK